VSEVGRSVPTGASPTVRVDHQRKRRRLCTNNSIWPTAGAGAFQHASLQCFADLHALSVQFGRLVMRHVGLSAVDSEEMFERFDQPLTDERVSQSNLTMFRYEVVARRYTYYSSSLHIVPAYTHTCIY
jgi:hypothetical protein